MVKSSGGKKTAYAIGLLINLFSMFHTHATNYFGRREITEPPGVTLR